MLVPPAPTNFPAAGVYLTQDATDAALVERVLAGDTEAFAPLVDRYQRVLFTVALRMLGNRADAADVTQTAFVRAFEKLGSYDPRYRFFSWIYRIALNECLNVQRAQRPLEPLDAAYPVAARGGWRPRAAPSAGIGVQAALLQLPPELPGSNRPAATSPSSPTTRSRRPWRCR